ncbi:MAG: hypothetical protein KKB30_07725 [Proteobacteria bacterium]|nr:hypothetical protein [Pseudomonadota bacterium]MBU1714932.1 hypothetical protein [Pseudomonadota bacterium]
MNGKRMFYNKFVGVFLALSVLLIITLSILGCAKDTVLSLTPPVVLPFAVQKAGNKVETELRIVDHREYIFSLCFNYKEGDQLDRERVKKLVGDNYADKNGDPGIQTPLKLKITALQSTGENVIIEKDISDIRLRSWGGDSFSKHIDYIIMKPGHYRVSVESLKDSPELIGTEIFLTIGIYPKSTPSLKN